MFKQIKKSEKAIEIDNQPITDYQFFSDGNNEFFIFTFNDKKILYAPHGLFPSNKFLKDIDIYIGSAFSNNDKICVLNGKQHLFRGKENQSQDILKIAPNIKIFWVDLNGNNVALLKKAKIYLKPGEKPPKGYEIRRGPKGGLYYETKLKIRSSTSAISDRDANILLSDMNKFLTMMQNNETRIKNYYYKGSADFLLKEGHSYVGNKRFTSEELNIIKKIKNITGSPELHACYKNSVLFTLAGNSLDVKNIKYVEGFGWKKDLIPVEHAWVTINDKVFDTTWSDQENTIYFGVSFTPEEVYEMHIKKSRKTAGMINVPELDFPYLKTKREK